MKFSVFFEIEVLPELASEPQTIENCLYQIQLAEELGFDAAWAVEHHFTYEYSHSTAPEMFFAAAAQRTSRIRLGPGVALLPFHHPINVAQRYAWLDVLSKGRLNMGVGRGVTAAEFATFRPIFEDPQVGSRDMFFEWIEIMKKAWTEETMSWEGKYISFPEIHPLPKPVQRPHPPLNAAAGSPDSFVIYPQKGLRVLGQAAVTPLFMAMENARVYHENWKAGGHDPADGEFGLLWPAYCAATTEQAIDEASGPVMWYVSRLQRYFGPRGANAAAAAERLRRYDWWSDPSMEKLVKNEMVLAGDPDRCIELVEKAEAGGVNNVLAQFQVGGMTHEKTCAAMKLFAKEVMPAFSTTVSAAR
jgi:alkanesulfonate monooxygenase SsuD/methylene tetrahydromethanopterin reductase-like flavin-dependent oxidoreductase (luciferase family)